LSPQHEKFAQLVAEGKPKGKSYMAVYEDVKDLAVACAAAVRLLKNVNVSDRVNALRAEIEDEHCLSRLDIRKIRKEIADDSLSSPSDRLKACKDDADMMGYNEPDKIEVEHSGEMTVKQTPIEFAKAQSKERFEQMKDADNAT